MNEEGLIKISPDKERVKSIVKMVKLREKRVEGERAEEFSTLLIEDYYEIIKELATALLNLDGFKTLSHKKLFDYIKSNYSGFILEEIEFLDELRRIRNKVAYEGFFVKPFYVKRSKPLIRRIILKFKKLINKKINI